MLLAGLFGLFALVVVLSAVGLGIIAPVRVEAAAEGLVVSNPGLGMRGATVVVRDGTREHVVTLASLSRGRTLVAWADLPDWARGATGAEVNGSRLGVGWASYSALRYHGPSATEDAQTE